MSRKTTLAVMVVGLLGVVAASAHAADDRLGLPTSPEAKASLEQGDRYFGVTEFDKAIEIYQQGALIECPP